jgi:RNA polymerase sigma-70 factor (ECF subfamily)
MMARFGPVMYRTARSIVKDDCDAEDVVQNASLLAYRGMSKFRGQSRLSTWLVRIVINEALMALRRRARRTHIVNVDAADLVDLVDSATESTGEHTVPPDEVLMRRELRRLIDCRIRELPIPYRQVFVLRAIEELSVSETSRRLGIPQATVRSRFFRARARLCDALLSKAAKALSASIRTRAPAQPRASRNAAPVPCI